jgi:predicted lysophospholipase L1 biosynthesis ABC-type transport system permease subunit
MNPSHSSLETLTEIRDLMQRSSKFLSLSGLSGIIAGVAALVGAYIAYLRLETNSLGYEPLSTATRREMLNFLLLDGFCVMLIALIGGVYFTIRKANQSGQSVWNAVSKRLLISLLVPLAAGGLFCVAMFYKGILWVSFPATLIFYGLALLNASKYTVRDVEYLGMMQLVLGLISLFLTGYNLLMWALGFGVLHIIYGAVMYYKYDRKRV